MIVSGFLNYDEVLQYARKLYASADMAAKLRKCRSLLISQQNLALIGARFSYDDYDDFYQKTFLPMEVSDEQLLSIPEHVDQPDIEDEGSDDGGEEEEEEDDGDLDFDEDFF